MYRNGDQRIVVSATDLVGYLTCPHYTTLSLANIRELSPTASAGSGASGLTASGLTASGSAGAREEETDLDVVQRRGLEHEAAYLAALIDEGLSVTKITEEEDFALAESLTTDAIRRGDDIVFQGTFFDQSDSAVIWRGHADFLRRVDERSATGPGEDSGNDPRSDATSGGPVYEPEDTKLARHVKPSALLQLCMYAEQLERVQGTPPEHIHVVLGGMYPSRFVTRELAAYYRRAKARFLDAALTPTGDTYPTPVAHCAICKYSEQCSRRRTADDHLSLVAGLTGEQARKLTSVGVDTVARLGASPAHLSVKGIGAQTLARLRRQARLQVQSRSMAPESPPAYELLEPVDQDHGLEGLPLPNAGDLFFDIEGDPYVGDGGLEYLLGVGWNDPADGFQFTTFWAHTPAEEKRAFEEFIAFVQQRRALHPDLHIYHYAPYEPTALGKLSGRHGVCEIEVDELLRGRVLVDLYRVVTQSVAVGTPSYSIKKLEPLYMEQREAAIVDAGSSIVEYERYLQTGSQAILDNIEAYNREDVVSTMLLRDWLEARRPQAEAQFDRPFARSSGPSPEPSEDLSERFAASAALGQRLTAGLDGAPSPGDSEAHARWLLAQLLEWHRREAKPEWWMYYARMLEYSDDDLYADSEALAGLVYEGVVEEVKKSIVLRYSFDPEQDHKMKLGTSPEDPAAKRLQHQGGAKATTPGTIVSLDTVNGIIELKLRKTSKAPHPTALVPTGPIRVDILSDSIARVANDVAERGERLAGSGSDGSWFAERGSGAAIGQLLRRLPPRVNGIDAGASLARAVESGAKSDPVAVASRLALGLSDSYLPIQGPPGCGKTFTAARVILELVGAGYRVGITANSHAVITNLIDEVLDAVEKRTANDQSLPTPRIVQKADPDQGSADTRVRSMSGKSDVIAALIGGTVDIVAGTAWLFTDEALSGSLDYLVIDEAGQISLANVVAMSPAATNLILVGDPQQLAQPSKGSHPTGAEQSGLEYILNGCRTIPDDRGLFLGESYRMHPDVCEFVSELAYDRRLRSILGRELQRVAAADSNADRHSSAEGPRAEGGSSADGSRGVGTSGDGRSANESSANESSANERRDFSAISGSGVRWVPVEHRANRTSSIEEVDAITELYESLVGRDWTNHDGDTKPLGVADILVVAPYNAQVHKLVERLGSGARVGTVDKFQGREAAVVIVSMTASSAEDVLRGMEFLYSRNRLNVAVSRARALSIVVGSPALLSARCRTVQQMRLVNGLCRFVEMAATQSA